MRYVLEHHRVVYAPMHKYVYACMLVYHDTYPEPTLQEYSGSASTALPVGSYMHDCVYIYFLPKPCNLINMMHFENMSPGITNNVCIRRC